MFSQRQFTLKTLAGQPHAVYEVVIVDSVIGRERVVHSHEDNTETFPGMANNSDSSFE
jgi:hypothetical protein